MSPPARTRRSPVLLRLAVCGALLAAAQSSVADDDPKCRATTVEDPRRAELLAADPNDTRIEITSDQGELGRAGDALLQGNVRIRTGQRMLTADAAEVDSEQRTARLRGNVEYLDPRLRVRGTGASVLGEGAGSFEGAEFELTERAVRGKARDARLSAGRFLELDDVSYTACPAGNDDWFLQAGHIELDQQTRNGTGRDVKLEFLGVPILYTPYITFPIGDQRKSGLLFPTIGSSGRTGTQVAVPWYWNIASNYDATFTGRYFSSRGLRVDPEFRYLTQRSRGTLSGEYLFDDLEEGGSRGLISLENVTRLQPRTRLLVDAAHVSDADYFEDFGVGFEGTSITYLDRRAELRRDVGAWSLLARVQDYQLLDRELPEEDRPYQVLPQLAAFGRWRDEKTGFGARFGAEFSNFQRELGPDGLRLDAEPGVEWRYDRSGMFVASSAAWRYTAYSLDDLQPGLDENPSRSAPVLSLDTGLVLERPTGSRDQRRHTLEPRLLYLYVPYRDQDDLPIFDTAVPDLNLVQLFRTNRYVGADRLGDANQVSAGVTTRLLDAQSGRQFLSATLGQAFYLEDPKVRLPDEPVEDRSSSDIIAELELAAYRNWNARFGYQWNPKRTQSEKSEMYLQYSPASDKVLNAGYRFRRDSVEQFDVSAAWPISDRWRGFGRWVYSLLEEKTLDQFVGIEYSSCCWAVRIVTRRFVSSRTGDSDTSIGLQLELKGLSNVGVDNEAFLREAIRGYSSLPPAR
jgi:LPS-assembly protein